jgi:flagellar hook protein FlgE
MSETFNLDRHTNIENSIDPTGKKWEIYHIKGSSLYTARPNPFNEQTKIPEEFEGRWTKHTLLQEQINLYLTRTWDAAEEAQKKAASRKRTQDMKEETKANKKTAKESIDELPEEIKAELGDVIATEE